MSRFMTRSPHSLRIPGARKTPFGELGSRSSGRLLFRIACLSGTAFRCGPLAREAGPGSPGRRRNGAAGREFGEMHKPAPARNCEATPSFGSGGEVFSSCRTARFPVRHGCARTAKLSSLGGKSTGFRSVAMRGLWRIFLAKVWGCVWSRRKPASDAVSGGIPVAMARRGEESPAAGRPGRGEVDGVIHGELRRGARP